MKNNNSRLASLKYISFRDILIQYGINPTVSNNRIYGNLQRSGLVATYKLPNRKIGYDGRSVEAVFDFITEQREIPIGKYQQTPTDLVLHLDPTCPWTHLELGGLCSIGLLNFETLREKGTNSKHPKKYICEESYFRLREFYEDQQDYFNLLRRS